jgi:hypothetical protein
MADMLGLCTPTILLPDTPDRLTQAKTQIGCLQRYLQHTLPIMTATLAELPLLLRTQHPGPIPSILSAPAPSAWAPGPDLNQLYPAVYKAHRYPLQQLLDQLLALHTQLTRVDVLLTQLPDLSKDPQIQTQAQRALSYAQYHAHAAVAFYPRVMHWLHGAVALAAGRHQWLILNPTRNLLEYDLALDHDTIAPGPTLLDLPNLVDLFADIPVIVSPPTSEAPSSQTPDYDSPLSSPEPRYHDHPDYAEGGVV